MNHPDSILQPSISPGKCWPMEGYQGQVVITLPAEILPTCVTVQHIFKKTSPSGTVSSAPKDVAVLGLDVDREEEVLLGSFTFDVEKEPIQTFLLKKNPPRAFQHIKFLVKSNWGNPEYTCIYRVMVHGKVVNYES
ncbi:sperm-associated antigen 4 protein-like isoform X2 [Cyrtonyx montezumae]|uniref:sperm-associated antigen 4 protein-like isoform X2 n=1 Tax=Cyrtonyx montezumae TaxID=9017 RepID=UPI0032D9AEFD